MPDRPDSRCGICHSSEHADLSWFWPGQMPTTAFVSSIASIEGCYLSPGGLFRRSGDDAIDDQWNQSAEDLGHSSTRSLPRRISHAPLWMPELNVATKMRRSRLFGDYSNARNQGPKSWPTSSIFNSPDQWYAPDPRGDVCSGSKADSSAGQPVVLPTIADSTRYHWGVADAVSRWLQGSLESEVRGSTA
jgi:hypothetical protein